MNRMPGHSCQRKTRLRTSENTLLGHCLSAPLRSQLPTCGFFLMASEDLQLFFQVSDVKKFTEMVTWRCEQPVAIEVELHFHDCVFMGVTTNRAPRQQSVRTESEYKAKVALCVEKYRGSSWQDLPRGRKAWNMTGAQLQKWVNNRNAHYQSTGLSSQWRQQQICN